MAGSTIATVSTGDRTTGYHAVFDSRRTAVFAENTTAVTIACNGCSFFGSWRSCNGIEIGGRDRFPLVRFRCKHSVPPGYPVAAIDITVSDCEANYFGIVVFAVMEVEGAEIGEPGPLTINNRVRYNIGVIRIG